MPYKVTKGDFAVEVHSLEEAARLMGMVPSEAPMKRAPRASGNERAEGGPVSDPLASVFGALKGVNKEAFLVIARHGENGIKSDAVQKIVPAFQRIAGLGISLARATKSAGITPADVVLKQQVGWGPKRTRIYEYKITPRMLAYLKALGKV